MKAPIAVMASGRGTNLRAILAAAAAGNCPVEVRLVLTDRADAGALTVARQGEVARIEHLNPADYPHREAFDAACAERITAAGCEWVVLAGYMRILSNAFIARFRNRIVNIHPALLPAFPGAHAVRDALHYGVKITGVTVHLVNEILDGGPILAQAAVEVREDDDEASLLARIHTIEHELYPQTLGRIVTSGFEIRGRRVVWQKT